MGGRHANQSSHSNVWWLVLSAALLAPTSGAPQVTAPAHTTSAHAAPCAGAPAHGCARSPKRQLVCAAAFDRKFSSGSHKARTLKLCSWPGPGFDPAGDLARFQMLESFALSDSNVSFLESDFPPLRNLMSMQLTGLRLESLSPSVFALLAALRSVDLRGNALRSIPAAAISAPPALTTVLLAGNPWDCSSRDMEWITPEPQGTAQTTGAGVDAGAAVDSASQEVAGAEAPTEAARVAASRVEDASALICRDDTFNRRPMLTVLRYKQTTASTCPRSPANCSCALTAVVPDFRGDNEIPVVAMDCSARGLRELPPLLPANATILHVESNQISDLRPLVSNPAYASVVDLYLDGNGVASVAALEGSAWLARFRMLSLRANRLRHLPAYALESALLRNRHANTMYLGGNPWVCDCQTTPSFQEFLSKYRHVVKDQHDIRCSTDDDADDASAPAGGEDKRTRVRDVSRSVLCREHGGYLVQPLDLLNAALAALIVLILGKLAYDYWHFKRTGKLPWIVTKMP